MVRLDPQLTRSTVNLRLYDYEKLSTKWLRTLVLGKLDRSYKVVCYLTNIYNSNLNKASDLFLWHLPAYNLSLEMNYIWIPYCDAMPEQLDKWLFHSSTFFSLVVMLI